MKKRLRPRYTKGDDNHYIPRDYLRDRCGGFEEAPKEVRGSSMAYTANFHGIKFMLIDMKNYGGVLPDWLVVCENGAAFAEVKRPEAFSKKTGELLAGELRPGEEWMIANSPTDVRIIETERDFENLLEDLL